MATVAPHAPTATADSRSSSIVNGHGNSNHGSPDPSIPPASVPSQPAPASKKSKTKKASDPNETSKLLAAKISQLELDAAGEKDQEIEIG
jgi:hypothetical protein